MHPMRTSRCMSSIDLFPCLPSVQRLSECHANLIQLWTQVHESRISRHELFLGLRIAIRECASVCQPSLPSQHNRMNICFSRDVRPSPSLNHSHCTNTCLLARQCKHEKDAPESLASVSGQYSCGVHASHGTCCHGSNATVIPGPCPPWSASGRCFG